MGAEAARYGVTAELGASTSVQEFAKIFEGLHELARQGFIRFRIRPVRERGPARILRLLLRNDAGASCAVAIDVADDPGLPGPDRLDAVDVLFKRSFAATLDGIRREDAAKILPFGLNNPAIGPVAALRILRARLATGRTARELAIDARQLFALPPPAAFEIPPETPAEPRLLFQTRLWPPATPDPGREEINEERATLIRTLRRVFGKRFIGGAIPTEFVRAHYADLATTLPFSMRAYPRLLRAPLIGIYTRGLRDSVGFKMAEYLAASRCIVGHQPTSTLPDPLLEGRNHLAFTTPDECIAQCEALLSRPADAAEMRRANWQYYQASVAPAALMQSLLDRAMSPASPLG